MKSLVQFINEAWDKERYGILIKKIDVKGLKDEELKKAITDGFETAIANYKIIRIKAIERLNNKNDDKNIERMNELVKANIPWIIKTMKTKPGIMKRHKDKKYEWIKNNIEKLKAEYKQNHRFDFKKIEDNFDLEKDNIQFNWHNDIDRGHSYSILGKTEYSSVENLANELYKKVNACVKHDEDEKEDWANIESLCIATDTKGVTNGFVSFNIYPTFPDEIERKLADSIKKFGDFMTREFYSNTWCGD